MALLVGTSSVARAKSFEAYDPPPDPFAIGGEAPQESSEAGWASTFGPHGHRIRLSLDGSAPPSSRPFRTTLGPTPGPVPETASVPPTPAPPPKPAASTPPVPEPSALTGPTPLPPPGPSDGEFFQTEPIVSPSGIEIAPRVIRMNLDVGSLGVIERAVPELDRPIRLQLDGMPFLPGTRRPFRNVLE